LAIFATQHVVRSSPETELVIVALGSWGLGYHLIARTTGRAGLATLLVTRAVTLPRALDSLRPALGTERTVSKL
jgi:hypothetical protein